MLSPHKAQLKGLENSSFAERDELSRIVSVKQPFPTSAMKAVNGLSNAGGHVALI